MNIKTGLYVMECHLELDYLNVDISITFKPLLRFPRSVFRMGAGIPTLTENGSLTTEESFTTSVSERSIMGVESRRGQ